MPTDPHLMAYLEDGVPKLERLCYSLRRASDHALHQAGMLPEDIRWFRNEIPRLAFMVRNLLQEPDAAGRDELSAAERINEKTAPEGRGSCRRWIGGVMGQKRGPLPQGGTPVISYKGKMTPARRLSWNLLHKGTSDALGPDERLHNIGCAEKSMCMNLTHWRKAMGRPDLGAVRATLSEIIEAQVVSPYDGRTCERGHYIPRNQQSCPGCRAITSSRHATERDIAIDAGMALRRALRQAKTAQDDDDDF